MPTLPTLQWSDALALGLPVMDDTHREFVDLRAVADGAGRMSRRRPTP